MIEEAVQQLLSESAQKTLETMFFAMPDEVSADPQRPAGDLIVSSLTFRGSPPGRFSIVASEPVARTLSASFGGDDDLTHLLMVQIANVMGELSNIICGSVLSDLESDANFEIGSPESIHVGADEPGPDFTAGSPSTCRFEFAEGALVFFLRFEEPS